MPTGLLGQNFRVYPGNLPKLAKACQNGQQRCSKFWFTSVKFSFLGGFLPDDK